MTDTDPGFVLDLETMFDPGPPEDAAHIVERQGQLGAGAIIALAVEHGWTVRALCGHEWHPVGHAPDDIPVCQPCLREWERITGDT